LTLIQDNDLFALDILLTYVPVKKGEGVGKSLHVLAECLA